VEADDYRPVLVYDGRCRFCVREAGRLARWTGDRVRLASFRDPAVLARYPALSPAACEEAVHLVEPDGRVSRGAEAIARALALRPGLGPLTRLYAVPGVARSVEALYALVARNRFRLGGEQCADDACRLHS
jgi:predicted DCC family thiol-disulfide oxidoreductase YuxK